MSDDDPDRAKPKAAEPAAGQRPDSEGAPPDRPPAGGPGRPAGAPGDRAPEPEGALPPLDPEDVLAECDVEFVRAGGPGGQHRNRRETGVRLTHRPTGITVSATERRSQAQNRSLALERMVERLEARRRKPKPRKRTRKGTGVRRREREARQREAERKRSRQRVRRDEE